MHKKKKLARILSIMLIVIMTTMSISNAATCAGSFIPYYHSNTYRKHLYTSSTQLSGGILSYIKVYDANSRYTYSMDYKKLSWPMRWDDDMKANKLKDVTISAAQGTSWSSTTAQEFSVSLSGEVSVSIPAKVWEAKGSLGCQYTNSAGHTISVSESQSYTATLTDASPNGDYYWAAILYYDVYEYECYSKSVYSSSGYSMYKKGNIATFKYSEPRVQFVRQPID